MPGWVIDMIGVFLGALLGALFGYGVAWWHARQEAEAHREMLLGTLAGQLKWVKDSSFTRQTTSVEFRSPITVYAATQLLSGRVLNARDDAKLIEALLVWEAQETAYNAMVQVANNGLVSGKWTAETKPWITIFNKYAKGIQEGADLILSMIPKSLGGTSKGAP